MAIVSISRIQHRRGLQQDLPNLAAAELGWSLDQQRLFIGNGPLSEGAPRLGNTEILTEHSDILQLAETYTYKNQDAGYTPSTGGRTNRFNSIAYDGSGIYVSVGSNGTLLTSTDSSTWSPVYGGTSATLNHVCYGNGLFVAVGASGTIIYSTDGYVWNSASTNVLLTLTSVVWAAGTIQSFIAVSNNGYAITSSDAIRWSDPDDDGKANPIDTGVGTGLNSIDFDGTTIVAVGNGGNIVTSVDANLWTVASTPTSYNLRSVKYDYDQWIATGEFATILISLDGTNWGYGYSDVFRAGAENGSRWVFVGDGGVIYYTSTTDLIEANSITAENLYDITYSTIDAKFIAVGANGTMVASNFGTSWAPIVLPVGVTDDLYKVIHDEVNSLWIAVGAGGTIITSSDGSSWTTRTSGTSENLYGVAVWDTTTYIVVGANGTILSSPNGTAWTEETTGISDDLESITVADLGGGSFKAAVVGTGGTILVSDDGDNVGSSTWTPKSAGTVTDDLHGVQYITFTYESVTASQFFAVGNNSALVTSYDDGVTWTDLAGTLPVQASHCFNVYYGIGKFWVVGSIGYTTIYGYDLNDYATLYPQSLLVSYTNATGLSGPSLNDSSYGDGTYVIVGGFNTTLSSTDGQNFISQTDRTFTNEILNSSDVYGVVYNDSKFIAVGNKGLILESTDTVTWSGISYSFGNSQTVRTLQQKLDDFVNIKDFGAKGDGLTDDTEAINRALYEIYCRTTNPAARKVLYFPGGRYLISDGLNVPSNAIIKGEGAANTIIQQTADPNNVSYAIITADSKQQIGGQIGFNGATLPSDIYIGDITLESYDGIWITNASRFTMERVHLIGNTDLPADSGDDYVGIYVIGSTMSTPTDISIYDCYISKFNFGYYQDEYSRNVLINGTTFENMYRALRCCPNGGQINTMTVSNCVFDLVYKQAIYSNYVTNLISTFNSYRDVGNHYQGIGQAQTEIILFNSSSIGCSSIADQFDRTEQEAYESAAWVIGNSTTSAWFNGHELRVGLWEQAGGESRTLTGGMNDEPTGFTMRFADNSYNRKIQYMLRRDDDIRSGIVLVTYNANTQTYNIDDDSSETSDVGVTFSLSDDGTYISLDYTSTSGTDIDFVMAESYLDLSW